MDPVGAPQVPTGYYGYPYDYLKNPDAICRGSSEHGGGSPVGAACYRGRRGRQKFRDNVFYCEWGKSKIQRFVPTRSGATFTATMDDFLVRDGSEEFRPLDLCFSPDGRANVCGRLECRGWTNPRICGRLFRVRYVGSDVPAEPAPGVGRRSAGGPASRRWVIAADSAERARELNRA